MTQRCFPFYSVSYSIILLIRSFVCVYAFAKYSKSVIFFAFTRFRVTEFPSNQGYTHTHARVFISPRVHARDFLQY